MALTPEQQAQLDIQNAAENVRHANQLELQLQLEMRRSKVEMIRLAKETLIENARSKPIESRDVSATDIQAFAHTLITYINE